MAYLKSKIPQKTKEEKTAEEYYVSALTYNKNDFEVKIEYSNILLDINKAKALKQLEETLKIHQHLGISIRYELLNNIAVLKL